MPEPLKVDWEQLKLLYAKGLSFSEIAKEHNLNPSAVRVYASRHGWKESVTLANQSLHQSVCLSLKDRGKVWAGKVGDIIENYLIQVDRKGHKKLGTKDLCALTNALETLDKIGRRTFELDAPTVNVGHSLAFNVNFNSRNSQGQGVIMDVDELPSVENAVSPNEIKAISEYSLDANKSVEQASNAS